MFKEKLIQLIKKQVGEEIDLEIPPQRELGDYSLACFQLAKKLKKSPKEIAEELAEQLKKPKFVEKITAINGYLNFFIKADALTKQIIEKIDKEKEEYGKTNKGKKKKIMIEFSAPNTNKPMHLGHIRTNLLGDCLSRIFEFQGYEAIRTNLVNDRGIHICKSMLAYQKFGNEETPESTGMKGDHFVGKYYVLYQQKLTEHPEMEEEAKEMLKKWEVKDPKITKLWKTMNKWCMEGFEKTYEKQGIIFDKIYFESEYWLTAKNIVLDFYKKGIFKKGDAGEILAELEKYNLPDKVLLRADGTSLYITQDIDLAIKKFTDYKLDKSIYVVAREQELHFRQLFAILNKMGYKWWDKCKHYSYGMVNLPEGKMKSREGTVVDADDLLLEMEDLAKEEIITRYTEMQEEEIHDRAHAIGLGALRFFMLKIDANKDMIFNPKEAIPFEGDTGPYMQYTYARTCSILRKAEEQEIEIKINYDILNKEQEINLIKILGDFPETAKLSCKQMKPHLICQYLIDLCRSFNDFYHSCPCLQEEGELRESRLKLVECSKITIKNALSLLGITALEEM